MIICLLCTYPLDFVLSEYHLNSQRNNSSWNENLATSLAAIPGNQVHVLTTGSGLKQDVTLKQGQLSIHVIAIPGKVRMLSLAQVVRWRFHSLLDRLSPDLVHGIGTEHEYPFIAATYGAPCLVSIHVVLGTLLSHGKIGGMRRLRLKIFKQLEQLVLKRNRYFTVTTDSMKMSIPFESWQTVYRIPNSVNPIFFDQKRNSRHSDRFFFLYVGRISPEKGIDVLIQAMARLKNGGYDVALSLVGKIDDKHYAKQVWKLIRDFDLSKRITYYPPCSASDIAKMMSEHDGLVLPSHYEAFGLVLAEAMAVGCPVVASCVGGIPEIVQDGKNGLLFTPGNVESLTETLVEMIKDGALRHRIICKGRRVSHERFHPSIVAQDVQKYYEKIVFSRMNNTKETKVV